MNTRFRRAAAAVAAAAAAVTVLVSPSHADDSPPPRDNASLPLGDAPSPEGGASLPLGDAPSPEGGASPPIDFEHPGDPRIGLDGGRLTSATNDVISGRSSLIADFRTAEGEWHEFLHTTGEIPFEPGAVYGVTFEYRILDPGESRTRFYSLLRSRGGKGEDLYGIFWLWNREKHARDRIRRRFVVPTDVDDYHLILGVRHSGSIVVDDIRIDRLADAPAIPSGFRLAVRSDALAVARDWIEGRRHREGLAELLWMFTRVVLNEGAGGKAVNARDRIVADLDPDMIDWNAFGPLARDHGIRTSRGGPEYQEYYRMEGGDVWDHRYELFGGNGFAVSLDNTYIRDETWGEGGYFTCHNGPGWHEFFLSRLIEKAERSLAVCQDNIACATFTKGYGCFCPHCADGFRRYLAAAYSTEDLARIGIDDLDRFDPGAFFFRRNLLGAPALEHPVVREWIKFQVVSQLGAWADTVGRVKNISEGRWNRPMPVYGNQIGMEGFWSYAVPLSQFCDVVEVEEVLGVRDTPPRTRRTYKVGRASAWDERPVWVRGPVIDTLREHTPELSAEFWRIHFAEAFACGGIRAMSLGVNTPWTGDPDTLDYMDDPRLYALYRDVSAFADRYRPLLARRRSRADVAVVYSLPSMIFRMFPPLEIYDDSFVEAFREITDALDEAHVPYDVVIFGHPEFMPDRWDLERYRAVVLPGADAFTDAQIERIRGASRAGTRIVTYLHAPSRTENLDLRDTPSWFADRAGPVHKNADAVVQAAADASRWTVRAPETVTVDLWSSLDGSTLDIHLVNYDANVNAGFIRPADGIVIEGPVPESRIDHPPLLILPGEPELVLPVRRVGADRVRIEVPPVEDYAIISFVTPTELRKAREWMRSEIRRDRAEVRGLANKLDLY